MATDDQKRRVKQMLVDHLQMRMEPDEIADGVPLFGEDGLGFDSVDGIEIVAAIEQEFEYVFQDEDLARKVMVDVTTLTDFLIEQGKL